MKFTLASMALAGFFQSSMADADHGPDHGPGLHGCEELLAYGCGMPQRLDRMTSGVYQVSLLFSFEAKKNTIPQKNTVKINI